MIRLPYIPEIVSGDISQLDPSNIADKVFLFLDDSQGLGVVKAGVFVPIATGITQESKSNADLVSDGFQWYLELPVTAVISCEVNGKSYNGQLDKTYPIPRYYCAGFIDDVTPQDIQIFKI